MLRQTGLFVLAAMSLVGGCGVAGVRAIDDGTGWGVEGATVSITDSAGDTRVVGSTDWHGEATFFPPKDIRSVSLERHGYKPFSAPFHYDRWGEATLEARLVPEGSEASGFDTKPSDIDTFDK